MKQLVQFVLFILFGIFLIVGFVIGASVGYANSSQAVPTEEMVVSTPTSPETAANGQHNLLVILVNSLDSDAPQLEGAWMVLSLPPSPHFTLLPLYPSSDPAAQVQNHPLAATFSLTPEGQPAPAFFDALKSQELWWMNWLVIDRHGLAQMIDLSGGLDTGNGIIPAEMTVSNLTPPWESQAAALESQGSLFSSLCQRPVEEAQFNILLMRLVSLSPNMRTDVEVERFAAAWRPVLQAENNSFSCEFPTFQ